MRRKLSKALLEIVEVQELRNFVYPLRQDLGITTIWRTLNGGVRGSLEDLWRRFVKPTAAHRAVGVLVSVLAFMNANIVIDIIPAFTVTTTATTVLVPSSKANHTPAKRYIR